MGDDISEAKPILDSRLPDGSRVAAVIPPCSLNGVTLTIRKFNSRKESDAEDLIYYAKFAWADQSVWPRDKTKAASSRGSPYELKFRTH